VLAELGVPAERTAVMGDDLTDLPLMRASGLAIAPADAVDEVRQAADVVTERGGGAGCVRELIELILKAVGDWPAVTARYDDETL
ncbi:MAG TPA: phenylphosphate carboxylase subunit delta, partial [Aurantimonas coralicida]|nr:phenylphosphate carboxylase subunit delta [Aurantimonas coralicida]